MTSHMPRNLLLAFLLEMHEERERGKRGREREREKEEREIE